MTKYAIVDTSADPMIVTGIAEIDETIDPETGEPRETMSSHGTLLAVPAKNAEAGWIWDGVKLTVP